jgi:hypothetical protein
MEALLPLKDETDSFNKMQPVRKTKHKLLVTIKEKSNRFSSPISRFMANTPTIRDRVIRQSHHNNL